MARNFELDKITNKEVGNDNKVVLNSTVGNGTTTGELPESPSTSEGSTGSGDSNDTGNAPGTNKPDDFVYSGTKPGEYTSKWGSQIESIINQYANREFSYDINNDELYQQYVDQYTRMGESAMKDVMGQASAMTGGYGNSYAAAAGSQAYQSYLDQLNDKALDFQQMAYDRYRQEGADMLSQYGMLTDQEAIDYGRYRDSVNDYYTDRGFEYGKHRDSVNDYETGRMNDATLESAGLSKVTNLISMGATPSAEDLEAAGLSQSQYNSMKNTYDESLEIAAASGENSFGEFTATEFCDKMSALSLIYTSNEYTATEREQAYKDALGLMSATNHSSAAMEIFEIYFEENGTNDFASTYDYPEYTEPTITYEGINPDNDPHRFANGLNLNLLKIAIDPVSMISATAEERSAAMKYFSAFQNLPEDTQKKLLADADYEID